MGKTSRDRDKGRKYLSGNQKRVLAKAKEAENEKHRGAINKFLVTPSLKRPRIENQENSNNSENDITMNPVTVDQYNYDINNKLEKNDTAVNKIEDNLNLSQECPNTENIIITGKKQAQTSYNDISSINTAVHIMNDDPANWPTAMNNNVRDYLAMKGPLNIPNFFFLICFLMLFSCFFVCFFTKGVMFLFLNFSLVRFLFENDLLICNRISFGGFVCLLG